MGGRVELHSLQQGRAIAALAVVGFHLSLLMTLPRYLGEELFSGLTRRGNLGVDFFFVLSGFIIFFAHARDIGRPERVRNYLQRRFVRLFPAYWVYLGVFCLLVGLGFGSAVALPDTAGHWLSTIFLLRFDEGEFPIAPAWTLVHELAFYLVFALLIVRRNWGLAVFGLWMLACLLVFRYPTTSHTPLTTYLTPLNLNFLVGMLAYLAWANAASSVVKAAFPLGLALLAGVYALESLGVAYSRVQLAYAGAFGLIIAGAAALESAKQWPSRLRLLDAVGDASYSIYLTHIAFLGLLAKILIRMTAAVPLPPHGVYLAVFAGTILCGCILHFSVERPLIAACRRLLSGRAQPPLAEARTESPSFSG